MERADIIEQLTEDLFTWVTEFQRHLIAQLLEVYYVKARKIYMKAYEQSGRCGKNEDHIVGSPYQGKSSYSCI